MNIQLITVGPYQVNCSIIWGEQKKALIVDAGYNASEIKTFLQDNDLSVEAYLFTHGHVDHISALTDLPEAPVYLHAADEAWAFGPNNLIPDSYPAPKKPAGPILHPENPHDWEKIGSEFQGLEVIETPGHTPGGVCYWLKDEGICLTGDTLFRGSCGRTDLPGGNARILSASLKKLATLPPETQLVPGHGLDTTIEHELKTNYFLQ